MSILGLDHVQVAAPPGAEVAARRFYGEVLGLREVSKPDSLGDRGGVWFELGSQGLHVGIETDFAPAQKAHPALRVVPNELDRIERRLVAAGHGVRWDEAIPGTSRFYTEDPWGNRIEFVAASQTDE